MTTKRANSTKRTSLPRRFDYTKNFLKSWIRLSHSGKYDLKRLKEVMLLLISNSGPLTSEWYDHALIGNWRGYRECHVGGDFLLVYSIDDSRAPGYIVFEQAGTHAELFDI